MSAAERPILTQVTASPDRLLPEETASPLPETVADWAGELGRMQSEVRRRFWSAYERTVDASESLIARARERSRRLKDERPLMLLGIVAGMAFAAGIGIAVWRGRESSFLKHGARRIPWVR